MHGRSRRAFQQRRLDRLRGAQMTRTEGGGQNKHARRTPPGSRTRIRSGWTRIHRDFPLGINLITTGISPL